MEARFSEDTAELTEGEEGNERNKDDDGAGSELFEIEALESGAGGLMMDEALDEFLDEVEEEDEDAEEQRFEERGLVERKGFGAAAEVEHLPDEDDFADHQGIDDGEGEVEGAGVVIVAGEKHGVGGDRAEEDSQVGRDGEVILELADEALFAGEIWDGHGCDLSELHRFRLPVCNWAGV